MTEGQSMDIKTNAKDTTLCEEELCPSDLLSGQEAAYARDIARLLEKEHTFVPVSCPACASAQGSPCFAKYGFSFQRCSHCGTIYMSPRPSEALMASYYAHSENYQYWAKHIYPATEDSRREKLHRPRLERIVDYCRRFDVPMGTLLEMGPGFGTFAALATSSGFFQKVVVVEPTPDLARACRERGIKTYDCRIEDLPAHTEQAHCIVAFEVIEHLFAVRPVIQKLVSRLAPGGLLILTCPNGQGFDVATLGAASLCVDSQHVNLFNPASLSLIVQSYGLRVLEVSTPGKLDAEFVREAALKQEFSLEGQPFLHRVLIEQWDSLGAAFQKFLAENGLSSHMWLVAQKTTEESPA